MVLVATKSPAEKNFLVLALLYISSFEYILYTAPLNEASPCGIEPVFESFFTIVIVAVGSSSTTSFTSKYTIFVVWSLYFKFASYSFSFNR